MTDVRLAITTVNTQTEAGRLAHAIVDERLAACVNIVPDIRSIYRWNDSVEDHREWLLLIKTTDAALERLRTRLAELHPYKTPELVVLCIEDGAASYLEWVRASVG